MMPGTRLGAGGGRIAQARWIVREFLESKGEEGYLREVPLTIAASGDSNDGFHATLSHIGSFGN